MFHALFICFHPYSRIDIVKIAPAAGCVVGSSSLYQRLADIRKGSCRLVCHGHADGLLAFGCCIPGTVIKIVFVIVLLDLTCPGVGAGICPGDGIFVGAHDHTLVFPCFQIFGGIALPVQHIIALALGGIPAGIQIEGISIDQYGRIAPVRKKALAAFRQDWVGDFGFWNRSFHWCHSLCRARLVSREQRSRE